MPTRATEPVPFSILVVCTGNICRSPLAAQLLQSRLGEAGLHRDVTAASAGLSAVVGAPMDPDAAARSVSLNGYRPADFRARQLRSSIANEADLVLTMTREQRDDVIHRYPRLLQRTFALNEFVKLFKAYDAAGQAAVTAGATPHSTGEDLHLSSLLRTRVRSMALYRSRVHLGVEDDVSDPFRQSGAVHDAVARQISIATSEIVLNFAAWASEFHALAGPSKQL